MLEQNCEFVVFMGHFDYFDHFGLCTALLWPNNGLRSLKSHYETGQDRPIGGQKATKMCFGTVLDHVDGILVHLEAKPKIEKKFDFLTILVIFGPKSAIFFVQSAIFMCTVPKSRFFPSKIIFLAPIRQPRARRWRFWNAETHFYRFPLPWNGIGPF